MNSSTLIDACLKTISTTRSCTLRVGVVIPKSPRAISVYIEKSNILKFIMVGTPTLDDLSASKCWIILWGGRDY